MAGTSKAHPGKQRLIVRQTGNPKRLPYIVIYHIQIIINGLTMRDQWTRLWVGDILLLQIEIDMSVQSLSPDHMFLIWNAEDMGKVSFIVSFSEKQIEPTKEEGFLAACRPAGTTFHLTFLFEWFKKSISGIHLSIQCQIKEVMCSHKNNKYNENNEKFNQGKNRTLLCRQAGSRLTHHPKAKGNKS